MPYIPLALLISLSFVSCLTSEAPKDTYIHCKIDFPNHTVFPDSMIERDYLHNDSNQCVEQDHP